MIRSFLILMLLLIACYGTGALGGYFTSLTVHSWYLTLKLPAFAPPGWIIAIVWNLLYGLIALAGFLAWRRGSGNHPRLLWSLYVAQLLLNLLWCVLFFACKSPGLALLEIIILWLVIAATSLLLWRSDRWAGILFLPYLAWVAFASFLNAMIWRLNV